MRGRVKKFAVEGVHNLNQKRIDTQPAMESAGRKFFFNLAAYGLAIVGIGSLVKPLLNPIYPEFKTDSEVQVQLEVSETSGLQNVLSDTEYPLLLQPFYYNPIRGPPSCDDDCRFTRTEVRVLDDDYKTPVGPFWWNQAKNEGGVACPLEYLGSTLEAKLPNGEKAIFHCFDTGGDIISFDEYGQTALRIDVLFEDGYGPNDEKVWNHPVTTQGYKLTDELRLEARVIAQP